MDEKPFETMNVIPFVDIMLVLLAMVLTTASFIATGRIPINLPQASKAPVEKHNDKIIELAANGDTYFDGKPVSKDEIKSQLGGMPPDTSFLIRADRNVTFQNFIDVADLLKRLNFNKVAVQTESVSR
ncbi:ExbD/TolR family protein [Beijerinckia indica]|uniref:Biopolymer transport protein ExbD/TolR n=1 Tax=Beijerinckia indica subsp. indica (strain ATCC 9039 / DSM 1715 / NCIMB 8712) TaxID=395963 RepID=B2IBJ8_BEII9|nr:biopolymer transporter ExbD [Beijerinckia indica]ACB96624.1 Biopolymer transport protein ExbD/TolR [Beijerinckia indica subsp. indica ATCC 9039]